MVEEITVAITVLTSRLEEKNFLKIKIIPDDVVKAIAVLRVLCLVNIVEKCSTGLLPVQMFTVTADTIFVNLRLNKNTNTIKIHEDIDLFLLLASSRINIYICKCFSLYDINNEIDVQFCMNTFDHVI